MNFTVAEHNDAKNPKDFIHYTDVEFSDIPEMVQHGAYMSCQLKDNYRKDVNYLGNEDVLIFDIDAGCTLEEAQSIFKDYNFFIITTKSHQREKNGVVCDRFRLFIELSKTLSDTSVRLNIINHMMTTYPFFDSSCRNLSRFFFKSPSDSIIIYNEGNKLDIDNYKTDIYDKKEEIAESNKKTIPEAEGVYKYNELKCLWEDEYGNILENTTNGMDNIENKLKGARTVLDREFYKGNRANCIFKVTCMLKNDSIDDDTISEFLIKENDERDSLNFRELMTNVKGGLRRA